VDHLANTQRKGETQGGFDASFVSRSRKHPTVFRFKKNTVITVSAPARRQVLDRFPATVLVFGFLHNADTTIGRGKSACLIRTVNQKERSSLVTLGKHSLFIG
jgi:hypothetical protein